MHWGYDDRERAAIQQRVNAKNKRRGYFVPMETQAKGGDGR